MVSEQIYLANPLLVSHQDGTQWQNSQLSLPGTIESVIT